MVNDLFLSPSVTDVWCGWGNRQMIVGGEQTKAMLCEDNRATVLLSALQQRTSPLISQCRRIVKRVLLPTDTAAPRRLHDTPN